jgi:L-seryl-tRNA(Ser) seleniumtransferase
MFHRRIGSHPVINVSGTMTWLGASIASASVAPAMAEILPQFVDIADLQRHASTVIAKACATQAGFITASCSAGITLAIAGAMTGDDPLAIERLPDTAGMKNGVVIQSGHLVNYGAPLEQSIRLTGARVVTVGTATHANTAQLEAAFAVDTVAAVYVISHYVPTGLVALEEFSKIAHAHGVPVIVDAASEYDLTGFLRRGADVALYSAHKFLGGPTAGIVAGDKKLVRAAYLQNFGIGRGFKVGKESIYGAVAALEAWSRRDHASIRKREQGYLDLWREGLSDFSGVRVAIEPDPTGNPLDRLRMDVDSAVCGIAAWDLADALAAGDPAVIVRDFSAESGYFYLDPCNLHPGEEHDVLRAITAMLIRARSNPVTPTSLSERRARRVADRLRWPD